MFTRRRHRLITVLFALFCLLFMQLALASYVCPGAEKAAQVAQMTEAGLPCAEAMSQAMDEEQPALCHAHCQAADQSADNFQPPVLASLAQLGPVFRVAASPTQPVGACSAPAPNLRRATAPPLAVLLCCFRI